MKTSTLLLIALLVANGALAIGLLIRGSAGSETGAALTSTRGVSGVVTQTGAGGVRTDGAVESAAAKPAELDAVWMLLETEDLPVLVARLRLAGFPPEVIRAWVAKRVKAQFEGRRQALFAGTAKFEFWKGDQSTFSANRQRSAVLRDLAREEAAMLRSLLGEDTTLAGKEAEIRRRNQFGNLSQEKADQLSRVLADYEDMERSISDQARIHALPDDAKSLAFLEAEKRKDLELFLTPEEIAEYEVRSSRSASTLRQRTRELNLTEAQFRQLYSYQKAYSDKFRQIPGVATDLSANGRKEAQEALVEAMRTIVGQKEAEQFRLAMEPAYGMTKGVVTRLGLPIDTAQKLLQARDDFNRVANEIRRSSTGTRDERNAKLAAAIAASTAHVSGLLGGEKGVELYKANGGYWLNSNFPPR
ncbi:MAG TPA: hypothetical protein PLN52_17070 [Opitutaceae bacterium]|nr:hypothetical protein [Opitutaceae bacterium]